MLFQLRGFDVCEETNRRGCWSRSWREVTEAWRRAVLDADLNMANQSTKENQLKEEKGGEAHWSERGVLRFSFEEKRPTQLEISLGFFAC
jgi:hypothetical protein